MNIYVFNSNDLKAQVKALSLSQDHIEYFSSLKDFENLQKTISARLIVMELNANTEKLNQSFLKHHPNIPRLLIFGDCNSIDLKNHKRSADHANFYLKSLQDGFEKIRTELEHEVPEHPESDLNLDNSLSDGVVVEKTMADYKFDPNNRDYLESETNQKIEQSFNYVFGKTEWESPMSESSNNSNDLPGDDITIEDDDNKATVVLDINAMKAELAKKSEEIPVEAIDIDFGGGSSDLETTSSESSLEMSSLDSSGSDTDLGVGLDIDLGQPSADMEMTNSQGETNESGLDLSEETLEPLESLETLESTDNSETEIAASDSLESSGGGLEFDDSQLEQVDDKSPFDAVEDIGALMEGAENVPELESEVSLDDSFSASGQTSQGGEELGVEYTETEGLDFSASNVEEVPAETPPPVEKTMTAITSKPKAEKAPPAEKPTLKAKPASVVPVKKAPEPEPEVEPEIEEIDFGGGAEIQAVAEEPEIEEEPIQMSVEIEEEEEEIAPPPPKVAQKKSSATSKSSAITSRKQYDDHQEYVDYHDDELLKLSSTIRSLRDDREVLLAKISKLEEERNGYQQDFVTMKADLDDKKIEVSLMKKRHADETNNLRYQLSLSEDKRAMYEEKNKLLRQEFDKLSQKVRVDFSKIQMREKELENQLELLKSDSEIQIRNRDNKILDLKRKIDTLEFDMENITHKESESRNVKLELENKLDKTIKTLRLAITSLEADDEDLKKFELLKKKNLDL